MLGQVSTNVVFPADPGGFFGPVFPMLGLGLLHYVAVLAFAYRILTRNDLDTQNRILWLLVVVLVPLGFILYLIVAPAVPEPAPGSPRRVVVGSDVSGTPWANKPGHTKPS